MKSFENYDRHAVIQYTQSLRQNLKGCQSSRNIECVHRSRTFGRRLFNTIWIFRKIFSGKDYSRWRKVLQRLHKNLNVVRDLDVKIHFLKDFNKNEHPIFLENLAKKLSDDRECLQDELEETIDYFLKTKTLEQIELFFSSENHLLKSNQSHQLSDFAQKKILRRLKQFLSHDRVVDQPENIDELHQMRIAAKKLRYSLETFEPFYGTRLKKFTNTVWKFQDLLGEVHDYDVWGKLLPKTIFLNKKQHLEGLEYFLKHCQGQRSKTYKNFLRTWHEEQRRKTWPKLKKLINREKTKI